MGIIFTSTFLKFLLSIYIYFFIFSTQNILLGRIPCLETLHRPLDTDDNINIIFSMVMYFVFTQILNPFFSANLLAPDDYTDDYFVTIYQFELENDFYRKNVGIGIYIDYFFKKEYPYSDPYFIKSGIPVGVNAGGAGLQFKYLGIGNIEFGIKFGYYTGNISYPTLKDSGIVVRKEKGRNSLGLGTGVNLMHNFGIIRAGIKLWINFIAFDAKNPRQYWYYQRSPDYISLSSVCLGIVFGLNTRWKK